MMLDWECLPLQGLGPLRFGMTPADVLQVAPDLGPPQDSQATYDGGVAEYRAVEMPVLIYYKNKLREINTDKYCRGLKISGVSIYESPPIETIRALLIMDASPRRLLDSLYFEKLVINLGGFWDFDSGRAFDLEALASDDFRGLAIGAPGAFAELAEDMVDPGPIRVG